ncbi:MAG: glycosyltransferase family 2 protein [bacterium]|nr:glycosyltransferase family 2 protein [bacterium]
MVRIAAVVILFNPDKNILDNINSYINQVEKVIIVDNSEFSNEGFLTNASFKNFEYIFNNSNIGVAGALNIGAQKAIDQGFDFLLTMDQDSKADDGMVNELLNLIQSSDRIGIVSAEHFDKDIQYQPKPENLYNKNVLSTITSGNLLCLNAYKNVGGFLNQLFIDHVDHEYCLRLNKNNYKVIKTNKVLVFHKLGNSSRKKFFRWIFYPSNHSPLRLYYRTRNRLFVDNLYRKSFPEYIKRDRRNFIRELFEIIAFERNVWVKIRMILLGYIDYKKNHFGKYLNADH